MRLSVTLFSRSGRDGSAYSADEARSVVESAVREFEQTDDVAGLARAWFTEAQAQFWLLHLAAMTKALERARGYARLEGRRSRETTMIFWLTSSYLWGPDPVDVTLGKLDGLVEATMGDHRVEAAARRARAFLLAWVGRTDEATAELEASEATFTEIGMQIEAAATGQVLYFIGQAKGRPEDTRRRREAANRQLEALGEEGYLSTNLALDSALLLDAGSTDEAAAVMQRAVSISSPDDLFTRSLCQVLAAQLDVRRGNIDRALEGAQAAVDALADSDSSMVIGEVCTRAAEVYLVCPAKDRGHARSSASLGSVSAEGGHRVAAIVERRTQLTSSGVGEP